MKLLIDTDTHRVEIQSDTGQENVDLYSNRSFQLLSDLWTKVGWNQKYTYTFSWMGRPIIQLPEDIVRIQEAIYRLRPDIIIETGIAHGGSLILYASLCKAMSHGRVVGVDIDIRPHNRRAIESHELYPFITMIEGGSTDQKTVAMVRQLVAPQERVLVLLDSDHSKQHVRDELEAYHDLVTLGSYIIATDGIMQELADVPRGRAEWLWDNPKAAALEFAKSHPEFVIEQPAWPFSESEVTDNVTHWPGAWLRRTR